MEKILPFFPLNLVVFPDEDLNLHVFEPRYKQLTHDCFENETSFGIPTFIDNKVAEYGTEMQIIGIEKEYEDGRMDIRTKGLKPFQIVTFDNPLQDRLYSGGLVKTLDVDKNFDPQAQEELLDRLQELFRVLQINFQPSPAKILSYEIAHKIGLSIKQEYELLCLETEVERQAYLIDHLKKAVPIISEMEKTKQIIRMNGHFKYFDPLNF